MVDAVSFVLSAALLATPPSLPPAQVDDNSGSLLAGAKFGLGYIWRTPAVRIIALGFFAVVACSGIDDVALVLLAKDTFGAGDSAVGLLLGAVGVGLLVGYLLLARSSPSAPVTLLIVGTAGTAATLLVAIRLPFALRGAAAHALPMPREAASDEPPPTS